MPTDVILIRPDEMPHPLICYTAHRGNQVVLVTTAEHRNEAEALFGMNRDADLKIVAR